MNIPHGPEGLVTEAGQHVLGESLEAGEAKLADAVILQAVRDLLSPRTSRRSRSEVKRFFEQGMDLYWLRGGSADSETQVRARHAKLLELVELIESHGDACPTGLLELATGDVEPDATEAEIPFAWDNPAQFELFAVA